MFKMTYISCCCYSEVFKSFEFAQPFGQLGANVQWLMTLVVLEEGPELLQTI